MRGSEFAELASFVAVAERGSFVKAATALAVSTSTLSQTIRALEERLGVRLLNRTTRSVALTEAGERLLDQLRPVLAELDAAIEAINDFRDRPAGTLRLNVSSLAAEMVIAPLLVKFRAAYPAIVLDITVDDAPIDIVSGRFDAGVRPVRRIEKDMIALPISAPTRFIAIAAPSYLSTHPRPTAPADLHAHDCLRFRLTTGEMYRWEFHKDGQNLEVSIDGSLISNNIDLLVRATLDGFGVCYMLENYVAPMIADARLVPLLEDWALPFSGYHIYYPSRRQVPAALRAFIDFVRHPAPT